MPLATRATSPVALELAGSSPAVLQSAHAVRTATASDAPVLIVAEAGFDSAGIAAAIHSGGPRASAPFVRLDCGNPPALVLQQLFGGDSSAPITDASALVRAGAGTLFLADVDQMPAAAQARLAQTLREGEFLMGPAPAAVRFRLIASTGPGLDVDVQARRFRPELFRRLQGIRVEISPLRERNGDLPRIIQTVLGEVCEACGQSCHLAPAAMTALASLQWNGNLEQLRATLLRLVQRAGRGGIRQEDVLADLEQRPNVSTTGRPLRAAMSLREARRAFERDYIAAVLEELDWRMPEAARVLGIDRANLYRKARQLGLVRGRPGSA